MEKYFDSFVDFFEKDSHVFLLFFIDALVHLGKEELSERNSDQLVKIDSLILVFASVYSNKLKSIHNHGFGLVLRAYRKKKWTRIP